MTLADRLDAYPLLPPDERAAVDREVADAPEWAARLADAQAVAAALDAAAPGPVTASDVARCETDRLLGHAPPDAARIDAAIAADPALAAEAARVRERLAVLAATAEPPAAQFARLTAGAAAPPAAAPRPSTDRRPARAADRDAAAPKRQPRPSRIGRLLVMASVCLVAYGTAFTASSLMASDRDRVAALPELAYTPPTTRSADAPDAPPARLDAALGSVAAARRATLGLFPRYDADALEAAAAELSSVAAGAPPPSSVSQEARFALGRVRLHQGRDAEAARVLGALVREGSYRAPEARRLLDWIRAQA